LSDVELPAAIVPIVHVLRRPRPETEPRPGLARADDEFVALDVDSDLRGLVRPVLAGHCQTIACR